HPIVVLVGVTVGFNLFGVLGALFAAPVLASLRVLGAYIHAKLLDYTPVQRPLQTEGTRYRPLVYRRTVTGDELAARSEHRQRASQSEPPAGVGMDDAPAERGSSTTQALNAP